MNSQVYRVGSGDCFLEISDDNDQEEWKTRNGITMVGGFIFEWTDDFKIK